MMPSLRQPILSTEPPSRVINHDTPIHKLFGASPDYSQLCVFGCAYWPNLWLYNTQKIAFRSTHCVFLGYSNLHKGYKCLDIPNGRVYISRDVIFDESVFPFSELNLNVGAQLRNDIMLLHPTLSSPASSPENAIDTHVNDSHISVEKLDETNLLNGAEERSNYCLQELVYAEDPKGKSQMDSPD
jgi:hypothetical protein